MGGRALIRCPKAQWGVEGLRSLFFVCPAYLRGEGLRSLISLGARRLSSRARDCSLSLTTGFNSRARNCSPSLTTGFNSQGARRLNPLGARRLNPLGARRFNPLVRASTLLSWGGLSSLSLSLPDCLPRLRRRRLTSVHGFRLASQAGVLV